MPEKRFAFTYLGADTLKVYLLHAPVVGMLRMVETDWRMCALLSAALIWGLARLFRWNGEMFGMVQCEGGGPAERVSEGVRTVRRERFSLSDQTHPG